MRNDLENLQPKGNGELVHGEFETLPGAGRLGLRFLQCPVYDLGVFRHLRCLEQETRISGGIPRLIFPDAGKVAGVGDDKAELLKLGKKITHKISSREKTNLNTGMEPRATGTNKGIIRGKAFDRIGIFARRSVGIKSEVGTLVPFISRAGAWWDRKLGPWGCPRDLILGSPWPISSPTSDARQNV